MYSYIRLYIILLHIMNNNMNNQRDSQGTVIHCPNSNCEYTWRYSGRFSFYATCPSCRRNIKIAENKEKSQSQSVEVDRPSQIAVDTSAIARGLIEWIVTRTINQDKIFSVRARKICQTGLYSESIKMKVHIKVVDIELCMTE